MQKEILTWLLLYCLVCYGAVAARTMHILFTDKYYKRSELVSKIILAPCTFTLGLIFLFAVVLIMPIEWLEDRIPD